MLFAVLEDGLENQVNKRDNLFLQVRRKPRNQWVDGHATDHYPVDPQSCKLLNS